jgi:hypothetical protein
MPASRSSLDGGQSPPAATPPRGSVVPVLAERSDIADADRFRSIATLRVFMSKCKANLI